MHFGTNGNCMRHFCYISTERELTYLWSVFGVRIAGNGASEKNLKDGVCAQFEKNFAKAKWRVGFRSHSLSVSIK